MRAFAYIDPYTHSAILIGLLQYYTKGVCDMYIVNWCMIWNGGCVCVCVCVCVCFRK